MCPATTKREFDPHEFRVQAGAEVTVVFQNVGRMPVDVMGHNLVILTETASPGAFVRASHQHPQNLYIDPTREGEVIAATRVLGPGAEDRLRFRVPISSGEYPFVCTVPGCEGMRGVMIVE